MSRTADVPANASGVDRNGDGTVDGYDDFLARIDGANRVRADLFVSIHNNWIKPGAGRTEAFYCGAGCPASDLSRSLAEDVLAAHVARLSPLQTLDWQLTVGNPSLPESVRNPTDDVLRFGSATLPAGRHFYVLGPYGGAFRARATEMPGVLMESLSLSSPTELELLRQPAIRTLIASAYADGIAAWLGTRAFGVRIDPVAAPTSPSAGTRPTLRVRLTNNGLLPLAPGARIVVGSVPAVDPYDGSGDPGRQIGSATLGGTLEPGRSTILSVTVPLWTAGAALWKVDMLVDGARASTTARMPVLQIPISART